MCPAAQGPWYGPGTCLTDWTGSLSTSFGTRPQFDLFPAWTTDLDCAPEEGNYLQTGRKFRCEVLQNHCLPSGARAGAAAGSGVGDSGQLSVVRKTLVGVRGLSCLKIETQGTHLC